MNKVTTPSPTVWTIGHSTRSLDEFLQLLDRYGLQAVADVRRFPGSKRLPHFGREALTATLAHCGIEYRWLPSLGGRRRPRPDSPNTGWRNASFKGYADHLESDEFAAGFSELLELATHYRTTLMCAEAVWWRCHRALISDVLRVRGLQVIHVLSATHTVEHPFTSVARVIDGRLTYGEAPPR